MPDPVSAGEQAIARADAGRRALKVIFRALGLLLGLAVAAGAQDRRPNIC